MTACNHNELDGSIQSNESNLTNGHNVAISSRSMIDTKVSIDPSDMQSVNWSSGDQIALWAVADGAEEFTFAGSTFSMFYYLSDYSSAVFTASVDDMQAGDYTYYATYPKPASVKNNSVVTFSVPSTQSGYYDSTAADIMLAKATKGEALSDDANKNCELDFTHLTHAIRIEIPEDRDLLGNTTRLQITFPQSVVGDISFDVTDPDAKITFSNASNVVYVDFDQVISQSRYVWVFINPTTIDGEIEFIGYDDKYTPSASITTTLSNREMVAGKITPLVLTIPEEVPKVFVIGLTGNNLGEGINCVNLTAPSGAYFYGDLSEISVPVSTADSTFTFSYLASKYNNAFMSGDITVEFESDNALISSDPITLTSEHNSAINYFYRSIPYLFEEDFSGVSKTDSYNLLTGQDLPGLTDYWTDGIIYNYWKGNSIAIKTYYYLNAETNGYLNLKLSGRTPLKSGKTVTMKITFDGGWKKNHCSKMSMKISNDDGKSGSVSFTANSNAGSSNHPEFKSINISSCDSESVITFKANGTADSRWDMDYDYIYMDNIKIQISK